MERKLKLNTFTYHTPVMSRSFCLPHIPLIFVFYKGLSTSWPHISMCSVFLDISCLRWFPFVAIRYASTIVATSNESSASETVDLETVAFSCWSWRFHIKWSNGSYFWIVTQWFKLASDIKVRGISNLYFHSIKTWLSFHSLTYSLALYWCYLRDCTLILTFLTRNSRKRSSRSFTGLRILLISVLRSVYCLFCHRLIYKLEISFNCLPYQHVSDCRTAKRRVKFVQSLASIALWKTDKTFRMRWILNGAYSYECISSELFVLR